MHLLATAGVFPPVDQHYLLEARQMQALSFAVHIPLVAFRISFPAMVLFVEWLGQRRGDDLYLTLARRWSKVMRYLPDRLRRPRLRRHRRSFARRASRRPVARDFSARPAHPPG